MAERMDIRTWNSGPPNVFDQTKSPMRYAVSLSFDGNVANDLIEWAIDWTWERR